MKYKGEESNTQIFVWTMARIEFPFTEVGKTVGGAGLGRGEIKCSALNM